jgi:hypothetical protein
MIMGTASTQIIKVTVTNRDGVCGGLRRPALAKELALVEGLSVGIFYISVKGEQRNQPITTIPN